MNNSEFENILPNVKQNKLHGQPLSSFLVTFSKIVNKICIVWNDMNDRFLKIALMIFLLKLLNNLIYGLLEF